MGCCRRGQWILAGLVCFLLWGAVDAKPATPPALEVCDLVEPRPGLWVDCCLPTEGIKVKEFEFPDPATNPVKIRKNMATLDEESIKKLDRAYAMMKALPPTDVRSWHVQSNIHCGYCEGVYKYQNSTTDEVLQIHGNWMLFPFHRWYVYFMERILSGLIGDPTLAIPYFNWDNSSAVHYPPPNSIPEWMYTNPGLNDENRDPVHAPPNMIDLHFTRSLMSPGLTPEGHSINATRAYNDAFMHQAVVTGSTLPNLFMSGPFKLDENLPIIKSVFESGPHFAVHMWVGSSQTRYGEDMGPAYSAARDPIFYSHHCNVDRIFKDWHALGGRRAYPSDSDFLDLSFLFYDELGDLVRVTGAQSLQLEKLRYDFEPAVNAWVEDKSVPLSTPESSTPTLRYKAAKVASSLTSWLGFPRNPLADWIVDIPDVESKELRLVAEPLHLRVGRPHAALRAAGKLDLLEEVLMVDDIYIPSKEPIWFEIFINLPEANVNTPLTATEWCGRYTNEPQLDHAGRVDGRRLVYATSIGEKLKKLGIVHQPSLVVSLVPKGDFSFQREVHVRTIRVELQ